MSTSVGQLRHKGGQYSLPQRPSSDSLSASGSLSATTPSSAADSLTASAPWSSCLACSPNLPFRSEIEFTKHLRQCHATKEGGSFVCHYGLNGVCPSLPLEGVSDRDYENHVRKHHVMEDFRGSNNDVVSRTSLPPNLSSTTSTTTASLASVPTPSSIINNSSRPRQHPSLLLSTPSESAEKWTVYDATTNVASVLSDPHRVRPADFFTKTWGDAFGRTAISPSPLLPQIERGDFQRYLEKTSGRCQRRREQRALEKQLAPVGVDEDKADGGFRLTNLSIQRSQEQEDRRLSLEEVPKIFFQPNFSLEDPNTFNAVFSHWTKMSPVLVGSGGSGAGGGGGGGVGGGSGKQSSKLLQEKLSHYLDIVEQAINDQIGSRSDAFFHALASHDELQDHMARTRNSIQNLRAMMKKLEDVHVRQPLAVLSLSKKREMSYQVYNKLKTMSTVHATQQTIQLLLATSEYVGALDLIATTQEVLANELVGVHCFRYLGTQLAEIEKVIDKMLVEDFVAYAQSDLNRPFAVENGSISIRRKVNVESSKSETDDGREPEYPGVGLRFDSTGRILKASSPADDSDVENGVTYLEMTTTTANSEDDDPLVLEEERLVALVLGMLRLNKFNFIDIYKTEIASATKTLIRQAVMECVEREPIEIETLPERDSNVACLADEMRLMTFRQWLPLMNLIFERVVVFLRRTWAVHGVMCDVLKLAAGKETAGVRNGDKLDTASSVGEIGAGRNRLLMPVEASSVTLDLSEEEYYKLLTRIRELLWFACDHAQDRCIKVIASRAKGGYMDKISSTDFVLLCKMVESFAVACEHLCGRRGTALRSSLTSQAARFVNRFHEERKTKLSLILDSERWKAAEVPAEFQRMAEEAFASGELLPPLTSKPDTSSSSTPPPPRQLIEVKGESFAVVGTVLLLMRMMADYCKCIRDIPSTAPEVLTKLVELLKTFNSRTCQLVMGAGALQLVGLKTISTKHLALASRSLQLALLLVMLVKRKYIDGLEASATNSLDSVVDDAASSQSNSSEDVRTDDSSQAKSCQSLPAVTTTATTTTTTTTSSSFHLLTLTKSRRLTLMRQFTQLEKDYNDHIKLIRNKFVSIVGSMLERDLEQWEAKAPVPSPAFRSLGRQMVKFHEAIVDLLPTSQIKIIFADIHDLLLSLLKGRLRQQGIFNDGGPQHGLVMTELAFYLENLKSLNGLDTNVFATDKVWLQESKGQ